MRAARTIAVAVAVLAAATTLSAEEAVAPVEARKTYDGSQLLRVSTPSAELKEAVVQLEDEEGVQGWHVGEKQVDLFVQEDKVAEVKDKLEQLKTSYDILLDDVQKAIDEENPPLSEEELILNGRKAKRRWCAKCPSGRGTYKLCCDQRSKGHRMTWQYYHRLDDIHGYLDYLAQTYPNIVSVQTIGSSVMGKPLKMVKISSGQPNAKAIWIDGGTHAREWITPASVTYILNQLVENRDNHAETVKDIDFYILPLVNPDGYEYSHTNDRLWRKNRAPNGYCVGTDLNRNWGYKWGGAGSSKVPCKEIFAGPRAFSEPETQSIANFVLPNKDTIKAYLTFHSYGQYVLYPWGYDRKVPPDYVDLDRVGQAMGKAMQKLSGHTFTVGAAANTLYSAAGGADDWAKGVAGIKYTYTIELPDTGRYGFILPASLIQPVAKEALAAVKVLAEEVRNTP